MDAIASTAFGIDVDSQSQPEDPFVNNIESIMKQTFTKQFLFLLTST